jgi:HSP20 family protein
MAETARKLPVQTEGKATPPATSMWRSMDNLRQEMERLFDDFRFDLGASPFRREPLWRRGEMSWGSIPAVDVAEKDDAYEITAELPGLDEKDIELKFANGMLTIKGEKNEQREEKKKDYHLSERRYGSFQRSFSVPEGVEPDKIAASFAKGVLTVTMPKSAEAVKAEKKIAINAK